MAVAAVLASMAMAPASVAEDAPKPLPTLLIKGEVVSVDAADPAAALLKVKDRYGFETPIYLTPDTKVTQGGQAGSVASLSAGAAVEVEYNFDINTAKRHAVNVMLSEVAAPPAPAVAVPVTSSGESAAAPVEAAPGTPIEAEPASETQ